MDCTDMVIGTARGHLSRIGDYYTRGRSTPQYDSFYGGSESLTAAFGYEEYGFTTIIFRKKLTGKYIYTRPLTIPRELYMKDIMVWFGFSFYGV